MQSFKSFLFIGILIAFVAVLLASGSPGVQRDKKTSNNAATCMGCKASVLFFRAIYGQNRSRDFMIRVASFICRHFVHEESLVCYGLTTQFREEILYVVNELILQPDALCSMFIRDCGHPETDTSSWNITLPPKRPGQQYPTYPPTRQENLRVLHITDIHLDSKYEPGSEADCNSEICCHAKPESNGSVVKQKSGYWGTLASCDVPYWTVDNMLQNIQQLGKIFGQQWSQRARDRNEWRRVDLRAWRTVRRQFDYIMVGGDYESHMDWTYTKEDHLETIRNLSAMLHNYFPDTPIYWTLGNHEGVPIDSFAPHYIPEKYRPQWLYDELLELQKPLLDRKSMEDVKYRGSYALQLYPGLRFISLNSGYCETINFWLYINQTDPDGTLTWLASELDRAELNGQYVHILSHIPPGDGECLESWARNYYKIVIRYAKTIKAQYFGHIHVDSFTVFYENMNDDSSEPISVLYESPSVTTFKYLNPAFRIYEIEPGVNYRVVNFHTYFLNLSKTEMNNTTPQWELLYSAKEDYGLDDLSPTSWDGLINRIVYEKKTYDRFIRNRNRQDNFICDAACRYSSLCFLRKGHHNATLCNHILSRASRDRYKFTRNPYRLPRVFDDVRMSSLIHPGSTSSKKKPHLKKENDMLVKKLRALIMKKFIQLFTLPNDREQ